MHVGIANPRWRGKRSRHSRRMPSITILIIQCHAKLEYIWPLVPHQYSYDRKNDICHWSPAWVKKKSHCGGYWTTFSPCARFLGCFLKKKTLRNTSVNTLWPGQNGRHFPEDIFKCIFLNENVWISLRISLKFVSKVQTSNGSWCIGIKGEMSGTVCVTFTWDIYIYMSCL